LARVGTPPLPSESLLPSLRSLACRSSWNSDRNPDGRTGRTRQCKDVALLKRDFSCSSPSGVNNGRKQNEHGGTVAIVGKA
jgi:hypothetical protein